MPNRKGEEIVEASIVLPLVILTILSMIMVAVYLFRYEISQSDAHVSLAKEAAGSKLIVGIKRKSASSSGNIRGTWSKSVNRGDSFRMYVISQADAVMIGELAGGSDE